MLLSREAHELASIYFSKTYEKFTSGEKQIQILVLSCLYLALKVDDSGLAKPFLREMINFEEKKRASLSVNVSHQNLTHSFSDQNLG